MALLKIKKYPDPILRKKCLPVQILPSKIWSGQEVKEVTEEIKKLGQDMIETLIENSGVGLAAPQVGELKRIIVIQTERGPEVFLNPKITKKSKETIMGEEGCLSFPNLFLKIKRAKEVEIKALDPKGKTIQIKAKGLAACVFQHEIDHLDGILFIDHLRVGRKIWELLKFHKRSKK